MRILLVSFVIAFMPTTVRPSMSWGASQLLRREVEEALLEVIEAVQPKARGRGI